jgi:hypothetical protein
MFGGDLPWDMIAIGGVIGAAIIAFDEMAEGARLELPHAGAGGGDRHLPAARTDGADLPRAASSPTWSRSSSAWTRTTRPSATACIARARCSPPA